MLEAGATGVARKIDLSKKDKEGFMAFHFFDGELPESKVLLPKLRLDWMLLIG